MAAAGSTPAGMMFQSLDFVYVPTADVDGTADDYVSDLDARVRWKVRGMGTAVACLDLSDEGPAVLLAGHLSGPTPILIYRVDSYAIAIAALRAAHLEVEELEIPPGPCASFTAPGGQRYAVYELTRPDAADHFDGRIDAPDQTA